MATATALCPDDLRRLLQAFAAAQFRPKDCVKGALPIQEMCCQLFERDTPDTIKIHNTAGELCTSYPLTLIIPRTSRPSNPVASGEVDAGRLRDLMLKARVARCRARFPVPVILFDGKYVCRSATLSGGPEIYGRSGFDLLFPNAVNEEEADCVSFSSLSLSDSSQVCSKVRAQDIHLLQQLGVGHICDLMVEKKKVKFGVYITSSEKVDKEGRYAAFRILSLPYPGCEFFRTYREKGYAAEGLVFDWTQPFVDAELDVPADPALPLPDVHWADYRQWDIIHLTQNYLRLFLRCLMSSDSSLLIHCISGWDRTPLFVSLLRLTLWADGLVHQSLSALEITFLTLAYDWYLFGHNLNDRLQKGEDILFFCFYFLQFLSSDDFSVRALREDCVSDGLDRSGSCTSLTSSGSQHCSDSYPDTPPTMTNSESAAHSVPADSLSITSDCSNASGGCGNHCSNAASTTPVPIPAHERRNSCKLDESWQFVSETGSIKDSPRCVPFNSSDSQDSLSSAHMHRNGLSGGTAESSPRVRHRIVKDERQIRRQKRTERLQMVRSTFYNAYSAEIGHRLKNGSDAKTSSTGLSLGLSSLWVAGACPNTTRLTAHP